MISNERFLKTLGEDLYRETGVHNCYEKFCRYLALEDLFTTDAVYMAACHCASGFRNRNDTNAFMSHAWLNSMKLAHKVIDGTFKPSYYRQKTILERGKKRVIRPPKFECKVVQKVMCDYLLRSALEPRMITASYASIRGRGPAKMYEDILKALNRRGPETVVVMTDLSSYFGSIDTVLLCDIFRQMGMDARVIELFHSFDSKDFGLSLGNETSQVPASWFPSALDHTLKDQYGYRDTFRFMDNTMVLANNQADAENCLSIICEKADELHLHVKREKMEQSSWGTDFAFCKERYCFNKADQIYFRIQNPRIAANEMRKLHAFEKKIANGEMSEEAILSQAKSVIGSMKTHPNNQKQVARIEEKLHTIIYQ